MHAGRPRGRSTGRGSGGLGTIGDRPRPQLRELVAQVPSVRGEARSIPGHSPVGRRSRRAARRPGDAQLRRGRRSEAQRARAGPGPGRRRPPRDRVARHHRSGRPPDRRGRPPRGPWRRAIHGAGPDQRGGPGRDQGAGNAGPAAQRAEPRRHPRRPGGARPSVPMVAVFDTAFHATIPEHASRYAIPHELAAKRGIRRYGFHGLAYRSVLDEYARMSGTRRSGRTSWPSISGTAAPRPRSSAGARWTPRWA